MSDQITRPDQTAPTMRLGRIRGPAVKTDQTILASDPNRKGNCVAACIATICGVPLAEVPHFIEFGIAYGDSDDVAEVSHGNNWWAMVLGFLAGHGLWVVEHEHVTDVDRFDFALVAGMSPRGVMHQVIYREGRLWHDPHPSRDGVLEIREVLAVQALPGFDHTPTTEETR
ncbi:hypothetical protein NPS01_25310 [Nocardioides psychrotolerans]|uniref:Uncharacterized protein n=1 Tax=Nocardioides psychrotolerans TaxID=1005945 RepID=A0A1I3LNA0_9ACTN|nr:hypothetical protein [Nocardioides psychrotolerans]GEP38868.1 hypothetical protein NPS01_25310 [Nocardioides psychrotolerans]SFI86173.1 hypothetical protein SAMN05216561_11436 [Nocardioides psychrotolerans]